MTPRSVLSRTLIVATFAATFALLTSSATPASAYPIASGTNELRPLIGATAAIDGQVTQFQMGVDWNYALNGPLGLVLGYWLGFGKEYIGMEVHLGVKYRFLRLHPRVAPFIAGGGGLHLGFPTTESSRSVFTALGFRFGGGVDFFATPRIIPGMQMMFDLGPGFTPSVGFSGSVQVTFGCSFLL